MSRTPDRPVVTHARQSLARARTGVDAVRGRLRGADAHALDQGFAALVESFASLESSAEGELPKRWSQFFACYDRVLALLRTFEAPAGESD